MPIGFKMKSNMVSERTLTLGPRLRFRCDEHPPFVVHGREGGVLENIQVPHQHSLFQTSIGSKSPFKVLYDCDPLYYTLFFLGCYPLTSNGDFSNVISF